MTSPLPLPPAEPFELSGGDLSLDFANTWGDRERPATERLTTYADLLAFARASACLPEPHLKALRTRADGDPPGADAVFRRARGLREALYRIFAAGARGRLPDPADLEQLNGALGPALAHLRLVAEGSGFRWTWAELPQSLDAPLWPILRAAADLLASPRLLRVRECDGAQCTWLFLDLSRAHSRRWCSMASCGNRAKARRHYQRRAAG